MQKFDLVFISTCCNHEYIYELVKSIVDNNHNLSVYLVIVNQDNNPIKNVTSTNNTTIKIIEHNANVNTSIARNIAIKYIIENNFNFDFLSFPDDDSSFDDSFFNEIHSKILNKDFRNFIIDVYCTGSKSFFRKVNYQNNKLLTKYDYNIVGAVNIVLNYKTFKNVLYFDTRFGVNAKYGAGEDGDYFIRATEKGDFYYTNELYNYHPSGESKFKLFPYKKLRSRMVNYGIGVVALLSKHRMHKHAAFLTIRALGGTVIYFVKGEFKISFTYFESFFVRLFYTLKFFIIKLEK
ncbi:glycosyltransferase [Flavobacterium sp. Root186]|uniref:glycosyltransferase n=1 Tax=Flavobacterium sp. Root186 TaxID=1736485 RepID=UPI0006FDA74E|nr:glycosyltransferase [Flavobacterium sp. Root186]KRB57294.1 hypothetical protein ASD98_03130 [Flavobacterium sp. Root186]